MAGVKRKPKNTKTKKLKRYKKISARTNKRSK